MRAREDGSQKVGEFLAPREKRTETTRFASSLGPACWWCTARGQLAGPVSEVSTSTTYVLVATS